MTVRVVIVSAAEDGASLDQLRRHLAPHLKSKLIELWTEGDIGGGQERERELRDRLDAAQIIVLLVSPDLIALGVGVVADIDGALARRKHDQVEVVPVVVRYCDWKATPLAGLQALPRDERPVGTWQHPDQAWTEIVREIRAIAERFAVSGAAAAPPHGSRTPSTPPPSVRPTGVFVGREAELRALDEALLPASGAARPMAICALHGMPGVGKSYLADHFAALRTDRFPGGVVRLVLRSDEERPARDIEAHLLGQLADQLHVPVGGTDAAERIRERLRHPRRLVHMENIDAFASARRRRSRWYRSCADARSFSRAATGISQRGAGRASSSRPSTR